MAMKIRVVRGLLLLASLALSGCSETPFPLGSPSPGVCAPVPPPRANNAANSYEQAVYRDECIHRWAYRLAGSRDAADLVAGAVIGACRPQIDRSATLLAEGDETAETWYMTEMERVSRERALYRVVQARAGNCTSG